MLLQPGYWGLYISLLLHVLGVLIGCTFVLQKMSNRSVKLNFKLNTLAGKGNCSILARESKGERNRKGTASQF